jgi:ABC-type transport system involved in cytochrome c biogenesis ATPase subunit
MSAPIVAGTTVFGALLAWSEDKPDWWRDAMRRIILNGHLSDIDIQELAQLCKRGAGDGGVSVTPIPLSAEHLPTRLTDSESVSLVSIGDVAGVNNLATDQRIPFAQSGLTIVYGKNGAGKSGYARILKKACRARHVGNVEPNIYGPAPAPPQSASIEYAINGTVQPVTGWHGESSHPALGAVSVFDSDCALVHINDKNEVAFRPFGLDVPEQLGDACTKVRAAITAEVAALNATRHSIFANSPWRSTTSTGRALAQLTHSSSVESFRALATLTPEERSRLGSLRDALSQDPARAATAISGQAGAISQLMGRLRGMAVATSTQALSAVHAKRQDAKVKQEAAELAAATAFSMEPLARVGGDAWRLLWESARRYSEQAAYIGRAFPVVETGARCVLCMQELQEDGQARLQRFHKYVRDNTQLEASAAQREFEAALLKLTQPALRISPDLRTLLSVLALDSPALVKKVRRFIASARLRRYCLLRGLNAGHEPPLPDPSDDPIGELQSLESQKRSTATSLRAEANGEERLQLQREADDLEDRDVLASHLDKIQAEIARLAKLRLLEAALADTTTNRITSLGNTLADNIVTPKLRDRFQQEIAGLAAGKVRVEVVRAGGRYGSPQYQVQLLASPGAKLRNILSEGEKSCVALAAFLTEVATAQHQSAFVFDDPVSSLDHRWRAKVAERLVEEAQHRQVIVFTHDLVFVNDLLASVQRKGVQVAAVTLDRGAGGAGIVSDGLPWKHRRTEERIHGLKQIAREARKLHAADEEAAYEREVQGLYNKLRTAWEHALEEIALSRVVVRHRDQIDTKELRKVTVLNTKDCEDYLTAHQKCSGIIEGHDPSSARDQPPPAPFEVEADIQALDEWVKSLRDRQKQFA